MGGARIVRRNLNHERQPVRRETAERLLQRDVVALAVLQDRLREAGAFFAELRHVRHVKMGGLPRVGHLAARMHAHHRPCVGAVNREAAMLAHGFAGNACRGLGLRLGLGFCRWLGHLANSSLYPDRVQTSAVVSLVT